MRHHHDVLCKVALVLRRDVRQHEGVMSDSVTVRCVKLCCFDGMMVDNVYCEVTPSDSVRR